MDDFGNFLERAMPLAVKMERLLQVTQHQRELHLDRLRVSSRGKKQVDTNMRFGAADMRTILNTWRAHPEEWMRWYNLEEYQTMLYWGRNQKAHQLAKSAFNTFFFQRSGCKFLLHKLIELPIISQISSNSVERPVATVLMELLDSYEEHKTTLSDSCAAFATAPGTPKAFEPRRLVGTVSLYERTNSIDTSPG